MATQQTMQTGDTAVTVVLVGIGGYGTLYVDEIFRDIEKGLCTLVGVVDPLAKNSPKYDAIAAAKIPVYATLDDFYREHTAELCCITAPIQYHTPFSRCALEHGSHVLCEKPLSGNWRDADALTALSRKNNRFLMSGYQWSYCDAILALKQDILAGIYGTPKTLCTRVLWPRRKSYFNRGSGWAGKRYAEDGTPIFDSIANNAAAHYLHNMLFLLGDQMHTALLPTTLDAELFRTNPIENFDSCVLRLVTDRNAELLFIATHCTQENVNPTFTYTFDGGTVVYDPAKKACIIGYPTDGTVREYGDPYADQMKKIRIAIAAVRDPALQAQLTCTVETAMPHARCIGALESVPIASVPEDMLDILPGADDPGDTLHVVRGLHSVMDQCFGKGCLISELPAETASAFHRFLKPKFGINI